MKTLNTPPISRKIRIMGLIEDSIFAIYSKALEDGDIKQAKKAVELAKFLKSKVEEEGFIDRTVEYDSPNPITGSFLNPFLIDIILKTELL